VGKQEAGIGKKHIPWKFRCPSPTKASCPALTISAIAT
jgi:hypothetical protein